MKFISWKWALILGLLGLLSLELLFHWFLQPFEFSYSTNLTLEKTSDCQFWPFLTNATRYVSLHLPDGTSVYNVTTSHDSLGRRSTPFGNYDRHLILFGGSYTYGSGLENNETLSAYLSGHSLNVYNYAYPSAGPALMLSQLQKNEIQDEVHSSKGIALYFFIDHHTRRSQGDLTVFSTFPTQRMPRYTLLSNGSLKSHGCLSEKKGIERTLYSVLDYSSTVDFLKINPPFSEKENLETTYRIILEASTLYHSTFDGDFHVVYHPLGGGGLSTSERKRFFHLLDGSNISVLTFNHTLTSQDRIPLDRHPSASFNKKFSKLLLKSLDS